MIDFLKNVINIGDESEIKNIIWYLEDNKNPQNIEFIKQIQEAFDNKNADSLILENIHVNLPTKEIAQRRLIKEKLRPEMERYPFTFADKLGNQLSPENDLDFVFMVNENGKSFKIVVASEVGIDSMTVPENIKPNQFRPELTKASKDQKTGHIIIPILPAEDGTVPSVKIIEIRKGEIDLPQQLLEEEENGGEHKTKNSNNSNYSPPAPAPVTQPRSQRSSSYVTVSH
jgi:hypothetical protein